MRPAFSDWMKRTARRLKSSKRGVAILMVMVVLTGLVALAAPFVFSMIQQSRSARSDLNQAKAECGARAAVDHAMGHLFRNLIKYKDPKNRIQAFDQTPDWDTLDELKLDFNLPPNTVDINDPNGLFWSAKIEDEQGKINVSSASPALFGNLMGSAVLMEAAGVGSTELIVDDASSLFSDGDPATVDGYICMGMNEPVPYVHVTGTRILLGAGLPSNYGKQAKGTLVYDGRAMELLRYPYPAENQSRSFRSLHEVKAIGKFRNDDFARIESFITIYSGRAGNEWGHGQLNLATNLTPPSQGIPVESAVGMGPGARVRFVQKNSPASYKLVWYVNPPRGTQPATVVFTEPISIQVDGSGVGNEITLEPQLRHPININTARPEVVEACVKGLSMATGGQAVDGLMARELAAFLTDRKRVYRDERDLMDALKQFQQVVSARGGTFSQQMRDAVYINATEPNSPRIRMPTATFCFRSYGGYTIDGVGIVNGPSGLQLAKHEIRQAVTLPIPPPGDFLIQTQTQFQKILDEGNGSLMVSWPIAMPPVNKGRRQPFLKEPDVNPSNGTNDLRLSVGVCDDRTGNVIEKSKVDHCDDYKNANFFQEGYNFSKGAPGAYSYPGLHQLNGNWMSPGGMEAWVKPGASSDFYLFDQGSEDSPTRNRISYYYDSGKGGLAIRIFDANLQNKFVEYFYPAKLNANEWYHVAGSWHGSTYNGMEARLDANPLSREGDISFRPSCKLAGGLSETAINVTVEEPEDATDFDHHFPSQGGAIRIGQEIIEYKQRSGYSFTQCRRGQRMSFAIQHQAGEIVQPYGYAARALNQRPILRGGGQLTDRLATNISTTVNMPPNLSITDTDDVVPVVSAVNFPSSGYVDMNGEIVYYGVKTATSLGKLERGLEGTSKWAHKHGESIRLISLSVTNASGYSSYTGEAYDNLVQIEDATDSRKVEWLQYEGIRKGQFLLAKLDPPIGEGANDIASHPGPPAPPNPPHYVRRLGAFRARRMTTEVDHSAKAKVIPVQQLAGPWLGDVASPMGQAMNDDISTLSVVMKGQNGGELRYTKRAWTFVYAVWGYRDTKGTPTTTDDTFNNERNYVARNKLDVERIAEVAANPSYTFRHWNTEFLAAFDDFTAHDYNEQQVRLIRWPSGEMPDSVNSTRKVLTDLSGAGRFDGKVDEVKTTAGRSGAAVVAPCVRGQDIMSGLPSGITTFVDIEAPLAWFYDGPHKNSRKPDETQLPQFPAEGLIRIDDELIYYNSVSTGTYAGGGGGGYPCDTRATYADKLQRLPTPYIRPEHSRQTIRLSGLKRGVLGSTDAEHTPGAPLVVYDSMPVCLLGGPMSSTADSFTLSNEVGFPEQGYVWIDDEVIGHLKRFSGCRPFRGRYGTSQEDHVAGTLVRCLPHRYFDRCPEAYDGPGIAFFQTGKSEQGALWDGLTIRTLPSEGQSLPNGVQPYTLVRYDGKPNWDQVPTNKPGGLFAFYGSGTFGLGGILADRMEVRVYWQYKSAFQPNADWKRTFGLDELSATYHHPMKLHRVEQIEKR